MLLLLLPLHSIRAAVLHTSSLLATLTLLVAGVID
jgi:hypothetical protein